MPAASSGTGNIKTLFVFPFTIDSKGAITQNPNFSTLELNSQFDIKNRAALVLQNTPYGKSTKPYLFCYDQGKSNLDVTTNSKAFATFFGEDAGSVVFDSINVIKPTEADTDFAAFYDLFFMPSDVGGKTQILISGKASSGANVSLTSIEYPNDQPDEAYHGKTVYNTNQLRAYVSLQNQGANLMIYLFGDNTTTKPSLTFYEVVGTFRSNDSWLKQEYQIKNVDTLVDSNVWIRGFDATFDIGCIYYGQGSAKDFGVTIISTATNTT